MGMKSYPREHGTFRGYKQHESLKEKPCRGCLDARAKRAREYRKTSEVYKKYRKEYNEKNRERTTKNRQDWVARNKEHLHNYVRNRYEQKKDHINAVRKKRYHSNQEAREKSLARDRMRRALREGVDWEPYTISEVLEKYGTACHICNEEIDLEAPRKAGGGEGWQKGLHLDHLIPISKGGPDSLDNIRPSHASCNVSRGAKILGE